MNHVMLGSTNDMAFCLCFQAIVTITPDVYVTNFRGRFDRITDESHTQLK